MLCSCTQRPTSHSESVAKVAESARMSRRPCSTACVMRSRDPAGGAHSKLRRNRPRRGQTHAGCYRRARDTPRRTAR